MAVIATKNVYSVASWRGRSTEQGTPRFRVVHKDGQPRHWDTYEEAEAHRKDVQKRTGLPDILIIVITTTITYPHLGPVSIDDPFKLVYPGIEIVS